MTNYDVRRPTIPDVQKVSDEYGSNFRLQKVNEVLNHFGSEQLRYEKVRKKYARLRACTHAISVGAGSLSALFTTGGIATSLTGPGIVVGIPLSAVGGFFGLVSASCSIGSKKVTEKISKHEKTIQLIISKKNSICHLVSKALEDNNISETEFKHIMFELERYEKLKNDIRSKKNADFLKKEPTIEIEKVREEMRKELVDRLTNQKN